ncbi:hypothetical protein B0H14DRAFT_2559277 [Mycena olivaceomarginata]|nr:hypothetical protein B0H14DRAFT_2559277 [Mycena olivaceomarginata]
MANPHASNESDGESEARGLSHQRRRRLAESAFHRAQQRLLVSPPASHAHAVAEVERCRRVLLSLSGGPPTSSDEEAGLPEGTRRLAVVSSDDDYYSTSSTSSGGSSTRDLEAKDALWREYQRRPADVIARFDRLAQTSTSASSDDPPKHEASCRRLRDSCKQIRAARRQARTEQRLSRWFSAKKEQEGDDVADDGDDEADNLRSRLELIVFLNRRRIDTTSCGDRREQDRGHGQTKSKRAEEAKDLIEGEELLAKREPEKQDRLTTWESGHVISKSDVQDFKFWGFNWDWRESDITDSIHLLSAIKVSPNRFLSPYTRCGAARSTSLHAQPLCNSPPHESPIMPLVLHLGQKLADAFNLEPHSTAMANLKLGFRRIADKHLNISLTMGKQTTATFSAIEQELKATFTEFNDIQSGVLRLQLTMAYVKTYGTDLRSHQTSKHQVDVQATDDDDAESSDDDAERSDAVSRGDFTAGMRAADLNSNAAPDIKVFLESFSPSLLYLYPTFVQAGITREAHLDCIATWPRFNVAEFFGGLADPFAAQTQGRGQGQAKLKKVVVEALVLRLKASEYKDGLD